MADTPGDVVIVEAAVGMLLDQKKPSWPGTLSIGCLLLFFSFKKNKNKIKQKAFCHGHIVQPDALIIHIYIRFMCHSFHPSFFFSNPGRNPGPFEGFWKGSMEMEKVPPDVEMLWVFPSLGA